MEEYDKISVLGRGSFGLIQLCRRRVDNTVLVVKQINTPINEEDSKIVAKEVAILSSLRHRHIVRYFDSFLDADNCLSIVMEWARGGSLEQLLQRRMSSTCNSMAPFTQGTFSSTGSGTGPCTQDVQFSGTGSSMGPFTPGNFSNTGNSTGPFTQGEQFSGTGNSTQFSDKGLFTQGEQFGSTNNNNVQLGPCTQGAHFSNTCSGMGPFTQDTILTMLAQLCDALAYLHSRRIVHRDLCARNVLLCGPSDSILYLKLCDFGVSKLLEDSLSSGGNSCSGSHSHSQLQLKGSLECVSPEQCLGLPYTTGCDIWALGCLLYRLITLKHPFPIDNVATLSRHLTTGGDSGHFESVMTSQCEPRLVALMGDMLSRDPHLRPTAHDLLRSPLVTPYVYTLYTNLFASFALDHDVLQEITSLLPEDQRCQTLDDIRRIIRERRRTHAHNRATVTAHAHNNNSSNSFSSQHSGKASMSATSDRSLVGIDSVPIINNNNHHHHHHSQQRTQSCLRCV